jgi:hypothetical protein
MLNEQEKSLLIGLAVREGGLEPIVRAVRDEYSDRVFDNLMADLEGAISLSVSNWALAASLAKNVPVAMFAPIVKRIQAAIEARDMGKIGPLLIALYGAAAKQVRSEG